MKRPTMLLVDDEDMLREILASEFEYEHFDVIEAKDIKSAKEKLKQHHIDVVLSDIRMPGGNGDELFKCIKKDFHPCPLLFFMTGYSGDLTEEDMEKIGVEAVFYKPFDSEEMIKTIKQAIQAKV